MLAAMLAQADPTQAGDAVWSGSLMAGVVLLGIVLVIFGQLLCLYRLLKGPHLADRVLAVDTMGILLIGLVVLVSIRYGTLWFLDAVLVLSLLAFAGTVAMAQYIARPHLKKAPSSPPDSPNSSASPDSSAPPGLSQSKEGTP